MKTFDVTVEVSFVITRRVQAHWQDEAERQVILEGLEIAKPLQREARASVIAVRELLPTIDGTPTARPLSLRSYGDDEY